jgi:probable phosphoglycerate mutase
MGTEASTTLMIIHHGETEWNCELRCQGHGHSPLTGVGRAQAQAQAQRLADAPIDRLISSDLDRTRWTAGYIAAATGPEMTADLRLYGSLPWVLETWEDASHLKGIAVEQGL